MQTTAAQKFAVSRSLADTKMNVPMVPRNVQTEREVAMKFWSVASWILIWPLVATVAPIARTVVG